MRSLSKLRPLHDFTDLGPLTVGTCCANESTESFGTTERVYGACDSTTQRRIPDTVVSDAFGYPNQSSDAKLQALPNSEAEDPRNLNDPYLGRDCGRDRPLEISYGYHAPQGDTTMLDQSVPIHSDWMEDKFGYVYADGSTIPYTIDGEPVNPLWGATKAGKARKRLPQACLLVRTKMQRNGKKVHG